MEIDAINQAPRWQSPLKVGVVKALTSKIEVAGLRRGQVQQTPDGRLVSGSRKPGSSPPSSPASCWRTISGRNCRWDGAFAAYYSTIQPIINP